MARVPRARLPGDVSTHSERRSAQEAGVEEEEREIGSSGRCMVEAFNSLFEADSGTDGRKSRDHHACEIGRADPGGRTAELFTGGDGDQLAAVGTHAGLLAAATGRLRHARPHGAKVPHGLPQKGSQHQDDQQENCPGPFHRFLSNESDPQGSRRQALFWTGRADDDNCQLSGRMKVLFARPSAACTEQPVQALHQALLQPPAHCQLIQLPMRSVKSPGTCMTGAGALQATPARS